MSKFIDEVDQLLQAPTKMDRTILKLVPWDVWAALAVAAMVLALAAFDQSPLLKVVLVGIALWVAYLAMQNGPRYRD
jgi:hypothetical protein